MHKVLIIDDEKPVRIAISKLGQWDKWHLEPPYYASDGKEALAMLSELSPAIVFVDMQMPVMNGVEFLRQASARENKPAFVVISGYDDFTYAQSAIHYGVSEYLLKPVVATELNEAIGRVMTARYPQEDFSAESRTTTLNANEVVELIHQTIEINYAENMQIQDFADKYFFSREYLSRLFKAKYHVGIYEYLTEVRMKRAAQLLCDPSIPVSDISVRVGYADNNYFSKAFKNAWGMSPSEYRKTAVPHDTPIHTD